MKIKIPISLNPKGYKLRPKGLSLLSPRAWKNAKAQQEILNFAKDYDNERYVEFISNTIKKMSGYKHKGKGIYEERDTEPVDDLCPDCGHPLIDASGGGVKCSDKCGYWFCY